LALDSSQIAVLVFDGFADWEPAFALTGLRRWGKLPVTTVGYGVDPITSMGGIRVLPDLAITDLQIDMARLFLMPGGDAWLQDKPPEPLRNVLNRLEGRGIPIAAICAATTALARMGFFRNRRHTSNGKDFLNRHAPGYESAAHYVDQLAVRDRGVITASGLGAVEFAKEIFAELGIFGEADLRLYEDMYRHGREPSAGQSKP
jgi:putative intracellular protease/amidase